MCGLQLRRDSPNQRHPKPAASIRRRANLVAAQWAWVGSETRAKLLLRRLRRQWAALYVGGEGYRFDCAVEGAEFRDGLNSAFNEIVGVNARWEKLGPVVIGLLKKGQWRKYPAQGV